jgi:hypothetical protein
MGKKRRIFAAIILVVALLFSSLWVLSVNGSFLFSKQLKTNIILSDHYEYVTNFYANFTDGDKEVSKLWFSLQPMRTIMPDVDAVLDISHSNDTVLDSMTITFNSPRIISVYLNTADTSITYTFDIKTPNTRIITITDFGALDSTEANVPFTNLRFEFILQNRDDLPNDLTFSADLNMHYKAPLQLSSLKAHAETDTFIPNGT